MPTILPLPHTTYAPDHSDLDGLLGDPLLASELTATDLPGETHEEQAARQAAAADILADLAPGPPPTDADSTFFDLGSAA